MKKKYVTEIDPDFKKVEVKTGALSDATRHLVIQGDEYIMFFFKTIPSICKLEGLQLKILMCCWKKSSLDISEKEGNVLHNDKALKEYIRECGINVSDATIDVTICRLAQKRFLIKKYRGYYVLNPDYFYRGTLTGRTHMKLVIETFGFE